MNGNSQRSFDCVPSRLRPQGTPLRMTGFFGFAARRLDALRTLLSLVVVMGLLEFAISRAHAVDPDVASPLVSYQYLDTLAEPGTTITSPVVSYQYFDWPGDENLTFQPARTSAISSAAVW